MAQERSLMLFRRTGWILCAFILGFFGLLYFYQSLLAGIVVALLFAYILQPMVDRIDRASKWPRSVIVAIVISIVLLVIVAIISGLVPLLYHQIMAIAEKLPAAKQYIIDAWIPIVKDLFGRFGMTQTAVIDYMNENFSITSTVGDPLDTFKRLMSQTPLFISLIINISLIPFMCFFFLNDLARIKQFLRSVVPVDLQPQMSRLANEINKTLRAVLRGQIMVSAILGVLYIIGLSTVGLKYSLGVGAVAGFCRLVPYMDVVVGGILAFVVIISDPNLANWSVPIGVVTVFVVVQILDGMLITPRVIGEKVGLHPGIVIVSIIALSDWLGFMGVLFAIPFLAVAKILMVTAVKAYRQSSFYNGKA